MIGSFIEDALRYLLEKHSKKKNEENVPLKINLAA
jgi:hypothetical protein